MFENKKFHLVTIFKYDVDDTQKQVFVVNFEIFFVTTHKLILTKCETTLQCTKI